MLKAENERKQDNITELENAVIHVQMQNNMSPLQKFDMKPLDKIKAQEEALSF